MSKINFLEDPKLSMKAKGIMVFLHSLPKKEATVEEIIAAGPDGRDSVSSGVNELVEHGYVTKEKSNYGYVYLIRTPLGVYKIGKTKSPQKRIKKLGVQLPFEIDVIHLIRSDNYTKAEAALHDKYKNKRVNGEWFNLSDIDVKDIQNIVELNFCQEVNKCQ